MKSIKYIWLVFLALSVVGCYESDVDEYVVGAEPTTPQCVEFSVVARSVAAVGSRSGEVGGYNEFSIHRGYIFAFEADGTYIGSQSVAWADVTKNGEQYPTITTNIAEYDASTDKLVAVFNYCAASAVTTDFSAITLENLSSYFPMSSDYLAALQSDMADGKYELGMPMFVNDFDDAANDVHEIYRSLARIELYVDDTDVSTSLVDHAHAFNPDNVKFSLLNSAKSGSIGFVSRDDVVGVADGETYQAGDPLAFEHRASVYNELTGVQNIPSSSNVIYLYEFPYSTQVITGDDLTQGVYSPERLSILIEHEDDVMHPGEVFYYKLQLVDKSTNNYYDICRNHDYRVVIKDVYSDGYTDREEAYLMPPSNIEYEVYDNQGDLTFSNGQYAISMDEVLNYESVTIYGPETTYLNFDNIRRILPPEVTASMTPAEIDAMTNSVEFKVLPDSELEVHVTQNDFASDARLTDEGQSIRLEISGDGECKIRLKIKLGNLELGFDEISITKVGSDIGLGGNSSFDAHPCQLTIENQNIIDHTWNSVDKDFGARNDGDDMIVYMGENVTPVGYRSLDGYISTATAANAYPYFEPKRREGYYSYYDMSEAEEDREVKKAKIILNQLAPFYVGHFGSHAESGPHYYNAVVAEKIEEVVDYDATPVKSTGGLLNWSEQLSKVYYVKELIYGSYMGMDKYLHYAEGRDIAEYIVDNNQMAGALPTAARYCYMKNDVDGDGVIESDEPIVWYLPAANQVLAMWISKHLIETDVDAKNYGFGIGTNSNPWYWSCSESAAGDWAMSQLQFENNVIMFNLLEGELNTSGRKGKGGYNDLAHVRCVRGIRYDNSK